MPPFHALSFALRIIVMHPCLVAGDNSFQDTRIFFILSNKRGQNLHALSLVHNSKLLGNPLCADFPVSQIIMQYGTCGSTADIQTLSHFRHHYPSVFSNHGICLSMWSCVHNVDGRPERPSSVTRVRPDLNLSTHS